MRTLLASYTPSFFLAGALCVIAALLAIAISKPARAKAQTL